MNTPLYVILFRIVRRPLLRPIIYSAIRLLKPVRLLVLVAIALCSQKVLATGTSYAVVIGITSYPNFPASDQLLFADADAAAFATFIKTQTGGSFAPANIWLLQNKEATRDGVYKAFREVTKRVQSDDVVYIYFAGHGIEDELGRVFFMPYDSGPDDPEALGIRADDFFQGIAERISPKRLLFFIDACHAGAAFNRNGVSRGDSSNIVPALSQLWQSQLNNQQQVNMAILSASSNQRSWEDRTLGHGIFTYFLLKGLSGDADRPPFGNNDGIVASGELFHYVLVEVQNWSKQRFSLQTPLVSPAWDPEFSLSTYATDKAPMQHLARHMNLFGAPPVDAKPKIQDDSSYSKSIPSKSVYDSKGRVVRVESGTSVKLFAYDERSGKVAKVEIQRKLASGVTNTAWSVYMYDDKGNLTFAKNSEGKTVKLFYDDHRRITSMVDRNRRRLDFKYNDQDKPVEISDPQLGNINVTYDQTGNIQKVDSPSGKKIALEVTTAFDDLLDIIRPASVSASF